MTFRERGMVLDTLILSGTENNVPGEHKHQVSIEEHAPNGRCAAFSRR